MEQSILGDFMKHVMIDNIYKVELNDEPFHAFKVLQQKAVQEGWPGSQAGESDSLFGVISIADQPVTSFTCQELSPNVWRIMTKLYTIPSMRNKMSPKIMKKTFDMFDGFDYMSLKLFTRKPELTHLQKIFSRVGYTEDREHLYAIGADPTEQWAWKIISYKGDLSLLQAKKMKYDSFRKLFGPYNFSIDWSSETEKNALSVIGNRLIRSALEIGTFEGRFTVWMADTLGAHVTTIDPYKADNYDVSQTVFDNALRNAKHNFEQCTGHINQIVGPSVPNLFKLYNDNKRFDFIYIDGAHTGKAVLQDIVLAWNLLEDNGIILLDDCVHWKPHNHFDNTIDHDIRNTPRMAVDTFIHLYWDEITIQKLPYSNQIAFVKR